MKVDLACIVKNLMAVRNLQMLRVTAPTFQGLDGFDYGLRRALDPVFDWPELGRCLMEVVPTQRLVKVTGVFGLNYLLFRLPGQADALQIVGPWRHGPAVAARAAWVRRNFSAKTYASLLAFYGGVPAVQDETMLLLALQSVLGAALPHTPYRYEVWEEFLPLRFAPAESLFAEPSFEEELPAEALARRRTAEGALLAAVSAGETETALAALEKWRATAPDYDTKTELLVFAALLCRTLQSAHVHPYYAALLHTRCTARIEANPPEPPALLLRGMVREYCLYVRRYSRRGYGPAVQKVADYIGLHLNSSLTLSSLAALCHITPGYLSESFKAQTGTTLIAYINNCRIQRAAQLLRTGRYTVAEVSEQVGMLDVNYFSRSFKKRMGTTPSGYRQAHLGEQPALV